MENVPEFITFVYGAPKEGDREVVWRRFRTLASGVMGSWLCIGDFNEVGSQNKKEGGGLVAVRRILNFQMLLDDRGFMDLGFKGSRFTWNNRRSGEANIKERINKGYDNVAFRESFSKAQVFHSEPIGSDHCLVIVDCCYKDGRVPKVFKFNGTWVTHEKYHQVVKASWNKDNRAMANKIDDFV